MIFRKLWQAVWLICLDNEFAHAIFDLVEQSEKILISKRTKRTACLL